MSIVSFHFFFDLEVFIGEGLSHFLSFESEYGLQSFLLASQDFNLILVVVQLFSELLDHVLCAKWEHVVKQRPYEVTLTSRLTSFPLRLEVLLLL